MSVQVTSPESFFGFKLGSDRMIARWDRIVEYFNQLGRESDRPRARFGIKTIGGTLTWKQNVMLFELAILSMMVFTSTMYKALMFSYISPLLVTGFGVPVMIYLYRLTGEDAVTGSHKLRPVAYGYLMLVPLFIAIGTVI